MECCRYVGRLIRKHAVTTRLIAPAKSAQLKSADPLRFDPAQLLAELELRNSDLAQVRDGVVPVVRHGDGPFHVHVKKTDMPGVYHLGVYVEGAYCPHHEAVSVGHDHEHGAAHTDGGTTAGPQCRHERFTRLLNVSVGIASEKKRGAAKKK